MQKQRIEWLHIAEIDLGEAIDDLMEKDPQVAIVFLDDVDRAERQLRDFPEAAPLSKDEALARKGYRVLLLEYGYLLFYKVDQRTVYVHRLIDGRRDYLSMF